MQLPAFDRTQLMRPSGADAASALAHQVVPVAPVNPSTTASIPVEPTPSVINLVKQAEKPNQGEPVYTSVSDPGIRGSEAATAQKDWTIHRPQPEKVEIPPRKTISQILIEHLRTMWTAGANAVQTEQVKNQLQAQQDPLAVDKPGILAKQSLIYSDTKVKKSEKM